MAPLPWHCLARALCGYAFFLLAPAVAVGQVATTSTRADPTASTPMRLQTTFLKDSRGITDSLFSASDLDRFTETFRAGLGSRLMARSREGRIIDLVIDTGDGASSDSTQSYEFETTLSLDASDLDLVFDGLLKDEQGRPIAAIGPLSIGSDTVNARVARARTLANEIDRLATDLVTAVTDQVYRWLIATTLRLVVEVDPFERLGGELPNVDLARALPTYVRTELTRSVTMSVLEEDREDRLDSDPVAMSVPGEDEKEDRLNSDYTIRGSFTVDGEAVRIDMSAVNSESGRLLASGYRVVEANNLESLSNTVAQLSREISWAMESDFRLETKTLVVAGAVEPRPLSDGRIVRQDLAMAREITRAAGRKLSLLTVPDSGSSVLDLDVTIVPEPIAAPDADPMAIRLESGADFMILVAYGDLGEVSRLTVQLYLFDPVRPGSQQVVYEDEVDVTDLNEALDVAVMDVVSRLVRIGLAGSFEPERVREEISQVKAHTALRKRALGVRYGPVASRQDTDVVFGEEAGNYVEVYYSIAQVIASGRPGGRFDFGVEFLAGGDMGEDNSFGTASIRSFWVNGFFPLMPWQRASTALNITVGGGIGYMGLRYDFVPGDRNYGGQDAFLDTKFKAAVNAFASASRPVFGRFSADATLRWARSKSVGDFADTSESGIIYEGDLRGGLGGVYFTVGLKFSY